MGATAPRHIAVGAIAFVAICIFAGCIPTYETARDTLRLARETQTAELRRKALQEVLNRRFGGQLGRMFPSATVGPVLCPLPPDMNGDAISRCFVRIDGIPMPILAQLNPTDHHLNAALGWAVFRRRDFEQRVTLQLYYVYGRHVNASCTVASAFIARPGMRVACVITPDAMIGRVVNTYVLDSFGWTEAVSTERPPDESQLFRAWRLNPHRVPGTLVARIVADREAAFLSAIHHGDWFRDLRCGKMVDLSALHRVECEENFDGEPAVEAVAFVNERLASRIEGTVVPLDRLEKEYEELLRRQFAAGKNVRVSIDCGPQRTLVLTGLGYHWCEIQAPARYPKRLVIAQLDPTGQYDVFFSDYSQSAYDH